MNSLGTNDEDLAAALKLALNRNGELEGLFRTVAHDLRSPIHTISGFAEVMAQDVENGQVKMLGADLRRIADAAQKMQVLIDWFVAVVRAGQKVEGAEEISLEEMAARSVDNLKARYGEGGPRWELAGVFPLVRGDRKRLQQAMHGLIDFVADAAAKRPGTRVRVSGSSAGLYVSHDGEGLAPDKIGFLLETGAKAGAIPSAIAAGLILARCTVTAHGGKVTFDSDGTQGLLIRVELPVASREPELEKRE